MGRDEQGLQNIRILESITPSTIGGAERYVISMCEALKGLHAEVELFCPSGRSFAGLAEKHGIPCTMWKTHGKVDPLTVAKLSKLIKTREIDVIHTHLSTAGILGAYAARIAGVPSIAHVHGLNSATCFRKSSAVIAVSNAVKEHLCNQGLDETKVHVVHNGLGLDHFVPCSKSDARARLGYDAESPLIGVFGRLSKEKGQGIALKVMKILSGSVPNAHLLLVGQGADRTALEETAQRLEIADKVRFTGFAEDVRTMMSACDLVVVPSLKEGFGLTALESMALQRPVVASAIGGLREIVADGETGFLVTPGDAELFAQRIRQLIEDKDTSLGMGLLGRARVEENFELSTQTAKLLAIINEQTRLLKLSRYAV